jgi:hypothetical protein
MAVGADTSQEQASHADVKCFTPHTPEQRHGPMLVAGAVGFGLAWLTFGRRSVDDVAERMSESSERYPAVADRGRSAAPSRTTELHW